MAKDGCNNMEKNAILRFHDEGQEVPDIARRLRLTERIVISMISHYRPDSELDSEPETKPKKKRAKKKVKTKASDEFDDED